MEDVHESSIDSEVLIIKTMLLRPVDVRNVGGFCCPVPPEPRYRQATAARPIRLSLASIRVAR